MYIYHISWFSGVTAAIMLGVNLYVTVNPHLEFNLQVSQCEVI